MNTTIATWTDAIRMKIKRRTWTTVQRKWRTVSGGLDLICDEAHPFGFWRKVMLELHGIDLPERL